MNSKPRETCPNCNEQYVVQAETYMSFPGNFVFHG